MDVFSVLYGIFLIAIFLAAWRSYFFPSGSLRRYRTETVIACGLTAACGCGILFVLLRWSADDVREDSGEIAFYLVASLVGVVATQKVFEFLGISFRDDAIERRNRGALFAFAGLTIGASCCMAGSNVGNGPGEEVVVLCALLSTAALTGLWILVGRFAEASEVITVERDAGAGVRTGGLLAGSGAVFGAAVAGDWVSSEDTLRDFARFTWPVFVVLIAWTALERRLNRRPLARRWKTKTSALLASMMTMAGVIYAVWVVKH